jgi:hypothetical protein
MRIGFVLDFLPISLKPPSLDQETFNPRKSNLTFSTVTFSFESDGESNGESNALFIFDLGL